MTRSIAERDIRSCYKQAVLGFAWAYSSTPIVLMLVFSVLLKRVVSPETNGAPQALWYFLGLIPWTFFSGSVSTAATSIIGNIALINKVPCPRRGVPPRRCTHVRVRHRACRCSRCARSFVITTFMPKPASVWVPVITIVLIMFVTACSILMSVLVVYIRACVVRSVAVAVRHLRDAGRVRGRPVRAGAAAWRLTRS